MYTSAVMIATPISVPAASCRMLRGWARLLKIRARVDQTSAWPRSAGTYHSEYCSKLCAAPHVTSYAARMPTKTMH